MDVAGTFKNGGICPSKSTGVGKCSIVRLNTSCMAAFFTWSLTCHRNGVFRVARLVASPGTIVACIQSGAVLTLTSTTVSPTHFQFNTRSHRSELHPPNCSADDVLKATSGKCGDTTSLHTAFTCCSYRLPLIVARFAPFMIRCLSHRFEPGEALYANIL